jgi:transcriptional regulator with XRE-family HTH domain
MVPRRASDKMADVPVQNRQKSLRDRFTKARVATGLSQEAAGAGIEMSSSSVARKERGEQVVTIRDVLAMERLAEATRPGKVPRGTSDDHPPGPRLVGGVTEHMIPVARLLQRPAVRERLQSIYGELTTAGADSVYASRVVSNIANRDSLTKLVGGTADSVYTESEFLRAIDNIVEGAKLGIEPSTENLL